MPFERNSPARCFMTPPPPPRISPWRSTPSRSPIMMPLSERKRTSPIGNKDDPYHVIHKVPAGDSPYVKAKQVQLVDKDPGKAISLFWAAINAGDRVESALKDMALVMKQLNRSDEAIEAIKSFRHLCPPDSQESLDNILVELYKRSGRVDEEISMLHHKLKQIEDGVTFVGRTTKQARSQGKKIHVTAEQEISRILGNLAWAYLQKGDYKAAEEHYRKALSFEVDRNKQCNLAICLMKTNRITEAKFLLQAVTTASKYKKMDDSCAKSFERASQMMMDMESSSSQCSPLSNLSGKSSDIVQSRTQNWSVTSEVEVSHARRRLYESPEPARRDLKVPYTNTKRCSWGYNNGPQRETWGDVHSDPKPSHGIPSTQNNLSLPANGKWNTRTMVKREDKTAMGSGSLCTSSNTETARKFKEEKSAVESNDMVVNGANQFASSIGTDQRNIKPVEKKSWADIVEEEQNEGHDFFGGYTRFDGQESAQVFNKENENSNIVFQRPWPLSETKCVSKKLESMDLKDGHHGSGTVILSRKPAVRRSLCFNPELAKERDSSLSEEQKPPRNNRLQVFKDIALHPGTP